LQKPGPRGLRSSLERGDIAVFPFHRPRSVCLPTASLEIRQGCCTLDSLSSTSSPASAFPWCFHHFGPEQQARVAFRPCRFTRLRRVSPPIARVFTGLFITVQGDEGLADLLHSAANRRVRCVSSASSGGASPRSNVIADTVPCWSLGLAVPRIEVRTPRRIPPTCSSMRCRIFGFASPRSLPPRTFISFRSATFPMNPFPDLPFLPYRMDVVPRGVAPLAGPYHRASYEDVRWPTLPGPCSPSKFPSCRFLRSDRVPMMPCIIVAPRLHTVAAAFAPSLVSHDRSCVGEARSVPCPVPVRSRPDCSGIRRIPRRAASPCDDAAQAGRNPVDTFDVAIVSYFGTAEVHPVSFSRTDRCSSLLVWCSFGHHRLRPPRGESPESAS
jgi:hypothetical protein